MREIIERLFLKTVRLYTFNTPISKGKYRLYQTALEMCKFPPSQTETKLTDGRKFVVDLNNSMHQTVYFLGEYEPFVSQVISAVVRSGDVCLDVGANFGWFTMLLHRLCGGKNQPATTEGKVYAFEPMPDIFANLQENWRLRDAPKNIFLNNLALGDENKTVQLYRFTDLPDGFSSLSAKDKNDFEAFSVPMITLDSYLTEKNIGDVNFIKLDVEGAELMFLRGATDLFSQKVPPFLIIEMALGTTKNFDYLPDDLIVFIRRHAEYDFFALDEVRGVLCKIEGFAPADIGANVLCVPKNADPTRLKNLKIIE